MEGAGPHRGLTSCFIKFLLKLSEGPAGNLCSTDRPRAPVTKLKDVLSVLHNFDIL